MVTANITTFVDFSTIETLFPPWFQIIFEIQLISVQDWSSTWQQVQKLSFKEKWNFPGVKGLIHQLTAEKYVQKITYQMLNEKASH